LGFKKLCGCRKKNIGVQEEEAHLQFEVYGYPAHQCSRPKRNIDIPNWLEAHTKYSLGCTAPGLLEVIPVLEEA